MESPVPLSISYRPYVLEMPAEDDFDGTALSLCLVVIKRDNGMILAVPQSFIPDDVLESAMQAGTEEVLGPSTQRRLPASRLAGFDGGGAPPLPMEAEVDVTLIDALPEFADGLRTVDPSMPNWELVHTFHQEHPTMFPFRDALVAAAWEWIGNVGADSRVHFYLAVEDEVVPECPVEEDEEADAEVPDPVGPALNEPSSTQKESSEARGPKGEEADSGKFGKHSGWPSTSPSCSYSSNVRARQPHSEDGGGNGRGPTVISIEAATWQLDYRWIRSTLFANQLPFARDACSTPGKAEGFAVSSTAWSSSESGAAMGSPADLTQAVLAQSSALTALVGQIAAISGDPLQDLAGGTSTLSSRRCDWEGKAPAGARSSEGYFLYQHTSGYGSENEPLYVLKCYAANGTPIQRGDCNTLRGALRWLRQVQGHRANHVASQHHPGSHPGGELECGEGFGGATCTVGLEQTALDNGQMDIGLLLALVEDPPAALFSNRAVAPLSRGRAFAPMAEQRWITTALSYIKELDAISNRRSDFTAAPSRTSGGGGGADGPTPKPKARKQPKAAWKKKDRGGEEEQ